MKKLSHDQILKISEQLRKVNILHFWYNDYSMELAVWVADNEPPMIICYELMEAHPEGWVQFVLDGIQARKNTRGVRKYEIQNQP